MDLKLPGTFINKSPVAFYSLVIEANQIHNFGTIQAYTFQFFQNYLFNKGVICVGEQPKYGLGLTNSYPISSVPAVPNFTQGKIENFGSFTSKGNLHIKGGLDYYGNFFSSFENLEMDGGAVIAGNFLDISGTLSGKISDIRVEDCGKIKAKKITVEEVQNLIIGDNGLLHSGQDFSLVVHRKYSNDGSFFSSGNLSLKLISPLDKFNNGVIGTVGDLSIEDSDSYTLKAIEGKGLVGEEELLRYIKDHPESKQETDPIHKRLWEEILKKMV